MSTAIKRDRRYALADMRPTMKPILIRSASVSDKPATIELIGRGKGAYLWIGGRRNCFGTRSGAAALRKLAKAILAEVGD